MITTIWVFIVGLGFMWVDAPYEEKCGLVSNQNHLKSRLTCDVTCVVGFIVENSDQTASSYSGFARTKQQHPWYID